MLALCTIALDAHAWGLGTHVYFAEALAALPLAVPAFVLAVKRFPQWVVAGACLPDLVLFGRNCGTQAFEGNHQWRMAHRLLDTARSDEEKAAAVGYVSHLVIDVMAQIISSQATSNAGFTCPSLRTPPPSGRWTCIWANE